MPCAALLVAALLAAPAPATGDERCRMCHADRFTAPFAHAPALAGMCEACHTVASSHLVDAQKGDVLSDGTPAACEQCHEPFGVEAGALVHAALRGLRGCAECHDPHGAPNPRLLRTSLRETCLGCHDAFAPGRSQHAAAVSGDGCLACHDPHAAKRPKLLVVDARGFCLRCHGEPIVAGARTIAAIAPKLAHAGAHPTAGRCRTCHTPHSSAQPALLKLSSVDTCRTCHDGQFGTVDPHPRHPMTGASDPVHPTDPPYGEQERRPFACVSCHEPHGTANAALARYRSGPGTPYPTVCAVCHWDQLGGPGAKPPAPPWNDE